jgi:hypothetical protein
LGETWSTNFDQILTEIETLREGKPTAIRLVSGINDFVLYPEMNEGMPPDFATTGGALISELLTVAMCNAAAAHEAVCVDEGQPAQSDHRLISARLRSRWLVMKARDAMTHITVTNSQAPG